MKPAERRERAAAAAVLAAWLLAGCGGGAEGEPFDPLAVADAAGLTLVNAEAPVQPQCYTKTAGVSNPCWTCHTGFNGWNWMGDVALQASYAFSDAALVNHWENLFEDRRAAAAAIGDDEIRRYIAQDNYSPLREAMREVPDYYGWRPDLDLERGFDAEGFARDGSWWRAFRYKPFLGTFWPTNGSSDDVIIRLPRELYTGVDGRLSRELYKINLALVELALTQPDSVTNAEVTREVEPLDERLAGVDLDGDGQVGGVVTRLAGAPSHYLAPSLPAGQAPAWNRWMYPRGTEFLHTVRYVDPERPGLLSVRLKELRYAIKLAVLSPAVISRQYQEDKRNKEMGRLPFFGGTARRGLQSEFGWVFQGFIEDPQGRLRLQTYEEQYYCMGCHNSLGVTVDQTFAFARKLPGPTGWGHQRLDGIPDVPQAGQVEPETLSYFRRVGAADEFRANTEMLARYFPGGAVDEAAVRRAAPGGDRDLAWLLAPSSERAMALNKAYLAVVRSGDFRLGRDTLLAPPENVHARIDNGDTGLAEGVGIFDDGRLWLDWSGAVLPQTARATRAPEPRLATSVAGPPAVTGPP